MEQYFGEPIHSLHAVCLMPYYRCLLSKKARPVMNLIYELLSSILTFSSHTQASAVTTFPEHNYTAMCSAYKGFRDTVRLLISGQ